MPAEGVSRHLLSTSYRDPLTDKWRKARYRAEVDVIRQRHSEYEIIGEPMVITGPTTGSFNPFRQA